MNKTSKLLLGAAALSFASCSNDEPVNGGNGGNDGTSTGDVAYLNVRIQSPEEMGARSVSGSITDPTDNLDKEYIYGDGIENDVKNAYFYFYDKNGNFWTESNSWIGSTSGTTDNVELKGTNTVVLTGLENKEYPSWVVTVLNRPDGFRPGRTLDEMGKIIIDSYKNENGYFIMTTSSYFGEDNKDAVNGGWQYFATKLSPSNFTQEYPTKEEVAEEDIVDIYVERLASRVGVDMSKLSNKKLQGVQYTETVNGETKKYDLYELDVTVAGETNPDLGGNGAGTAATKVYIAILGWELNATAKRTNLMKDLTDWSDNTTFGGTSWAWNHADNHRSYWGKSYTYGKSGSALTNLLNLSEYKWTELDQTVGTAVFNGTRVYCNETTNEAANILTNNAVAPNKTPSIMLRAVVCDGKGNPMQLVNYLGTEFTKEAFINKALEMIRPADYKRTYYTREVKSQDADGNNIYKYTEIGPDNVELALSKDGTGAVKLVAKDGEYYTLGEAIEKEDKDGNKYTTYEATPAEISSVNSFLAKATEGRSNKAIAKTDGMMYYPLPINHLNQPVAGTDVIEGQYGLVRNHIYNLSISKIKTLGEGVFDPNELIVPEDPKDPQYYVESAINILAWKVVSQEVEI